jgi:hypothetical protein
MTVAVPQTADAQTPPVVNPPSATWVFGDSIAEEPAWPTQLGYTNLAVGGSGILHSINAGIQTVPQRIDHIFATRTDRPKRVLIAAGHNDIVQLADSALGNLFWGYIGVHEKLRGYGVEDVRFLTLTPFRNPASPGTGGWPAEWIGPLDVRRQIVNDWMRSQWVRNGCDVEGWLRDGGRWAWDHYIQSDRLHPTAAGQARLTEAVGFLVGDTP